MRAQVWQTAGVPLMAPAASGMSTRVTGKAGAVVVPLDAAEPPLAQRRLAASLRAG